VFVGNRVVIGNNVKILNSVSVYDNVTMEDDVFCGPSMVFTNVYNPWSAVTCKDEYRDTRVTRGATLGANSTVVCSVTIGEHEFMAAGVVVNRDGKPFAQMACVPAQEIGWMSAFGEHVPSSLNWSSEHRCLHSGDRYALGGTQLTRYPA
jgi:UDP-2-acetamido-3-amino-2,3-dideoxy-glucuronate N-acetyltransferase